MFAFFKTLRNDAKLQSKIDLFEDLKRKFNRAETSEEQRRLMRAMSSAAQKIPFLKGWPFDREVFWDDDASVWDFRIDRKDRESLRKKLLKFAKGKTLELGCGTQPYIENSVCLDISHQMLFNIKPPLHETVNKAWPFRIQADIDGHFLPFKDGSFDTAVLAFVANYIGNPDRLFAEIRRVVNDRVVVVQSEEPVCYTHTLVEMHPPAKLKKIIHSVMKKSGFNVIVKDVQVGGHRLSFFNGKLS